MLVSLFNKEANRSDSVAYRVFESLHDAPETRDDDRKLLAAVWRKELQGAPDHLEPLTALAIGFLTKPETVRRARQKVQNEFDELRGRQWKRRHPEIEELWIHIDGSST